LQGVRWAGKRVRLLGVTATRLLPATGAPGDQLHLFQKAAEPKERLARTVDAIRERYGSAAITRASLVSTTPTRKASKSARKDSLPR
ncbi:MAG TPA: hypothetical protein VLM91_13570, partial [Candidatus Methylomirabilis sp.]|nr:hypothetical protein [Candidatus Methylomirabilis sp.]